MKATWIWYPGDYEIWLGNKMNNRRTDRGAYFPPFWKQDSHYVTVEFSTEVDLCRPETMLISAEGAYNIKIDGKMLFGMQKCVEISSGRHKINIKVHNQATPPALYVCGETIATDASWHVTFEDKEWIDESGKASDTSATVYQWAGCWHFDTPEDKPSDYQLPCSHEDAVRVQAVDASKAVLSEDTPADTVVDQVHPKLFDFGRETFGFAILHGIKGEGKIYLYYGESAEEAMDKAYCETYDMLVVKNGCVEDLSTGCTKVLQAACPPSEASYRLSLSKAFRYVQVLVEGILRVENLSMDYEYLPEETRGRFKCNDEELNRIWDMGVYTMQLTTREFFIDGIKRDRWVWSGDAAQSYLMNYYLFYDNDCVKRTIWLLAGKAPITSHINTIMDYTFYWFCSIADYYLYSGDEAFLRQIYPAMQTYMKYVLERTDEDGMVQGLCGDWVFVDWADEPMDKHGQLAFEQILFCKSLESIALVAKAVGAMDDASKYTLLANALSDKLLPFFWNEEKQALVHNRVARKQSDKVFRYANMFAILYNYLDAGKKEAVVKSVIDNDKVLKITTPYMRFYELEALCALDHQTQVLHEMKDYWGGMLRKGATSFWEKYNPQEQGRDMLAMYGRPYGKSLCHAWGASPVYLLGRYYLGIQPVTAGYTQWEARPVLGGLQWMEGCVPTPYGQIYLKMDQEKITVKSDGGEGTLIVGDKRISVPAGQTVALNRE